MSDAIAILLWVVVPYLAIAIFVIGHIGRYRYDRFGGSVRSNPSTEGRVVRWGSPLFHFGIFWVFANHVVDLLIPASWLEAVGISAELYAVIAAPLDTLAMLVMLVGLTILIYRRRTVGTMFLTTTVLDKIMYVTLAAVPLLAIAATVVGAASGSGGFDVRETVAPWIRSVLFFQPQPELMAGVPLLFQLHVLAAWLLFALWPFTRLVHAFAAPLGYLVRPNIVYRSRDAAAQNRPEHRVR